MRPSGYSLILISTHGTPSVVSPAGTTRRLPSSPRTLTAKALYVRCTTVCDARTFAFVRNGCARADCCERRRVYVAGGWGGVGGGSREAG